MPFICIVLMISLGLSECNSKGINCIEIKPIGSIDQSFPKLTISTDSIRNESPQKVFNIIVPYAVIHKVELAGTQLTENTFLKTHPTKSDSLYRGCKVNMCCNGQTGNPERLIGIAEAGQFYEQIAVIFINNRIDTASINQVIELKEKCELMIMN